MPLEAEQIAGFIVFPFALIGLIANWTVAIFIHGLPSLSNSFGRLTTSQSIGDAVHSTLFAFYFCPMCIFDVQILKTYSWICGHILLVAYDISTYSHLLISLNRFCSIAMPTEYSNVFKIRNTNFMLFFFWLLAILSSFYLYIYNDCKLYYFDKFWTFAYLDNPVCNTISFYADYLKFNSIVFTIVVIDIITVSKIRSFKAKLASSTMQSHSKQAAEISFLKQACLQAFVFTCELTTYFMITPRIPDSHRWLKFGLSTVMWVWVHMTDGIITLTFNKEFRKLFLRQTEINDVSIIRMNQMSGLAAPEMRYRNCTKDNDQFFQLADLSSFILSKMFLNKSSKIFDFVF